MFTLSIRIQAGEALSKLRRVEKSVTSESRRAVAEASKRLTNYVKTKYLSPPYSLFASFAGQGTHSGFLMKRSGTLYRSTKSERVVTTKQGYEGGVSIGSGAKPYVNVLVKKTPKKTRIKADGEYLAIPLASARDARGRPIMTPRSIPSPSFVYKHAGNLYQASRRTKITYFVLKKSVIVPSKVHTDEIATKYSPMIGKIVAAHMREAIAKQIVKLWF